MIESLSAVTLHVAEMARSFAFYEALGFPVHYGDPGSTFASFHVGPSAYLNLQVAAAPPEAVWGRVIIHVDDVDAFHERCRRMGAAPAAPPADAPWGERYFHVLDPDGHELSFAKYLSG